MTGKKPGTKWISFIIIITALFLASCNLLRPPAPEESEGEKRKNPPKALTQMEKVTDDIIQDLEEVREKRAKQLREEKSPSRESQPEDQQEQAQQQKEGQQMGQGQENQQDNQGGEQQSQEQQNTQPGQQQGQQTQQPQQTPQPIPEPDWSKLESMAETLNEQWNSFEPAAKSDGAMSETMKRFEEQLISLTEQIMARNEEKTLVAANSLYSYYPDFLKLYFHNQPPEIKELRGLTRQIILYGQQDKWREVKPLMEQMKKSWQEARTKMKKPDKALNKRIDAALNDFYFVVSEKKINMAKIKGNILIKNLDQVE